MVINMLQGGAAISVLCRHAAIACRVVDLGVKTDIAGPPELLAQLIPRKVCRGSHNFLHEAAMSPAECWQAIKHGYELAATSGADLAGLGEMGIGNTTAAAALYALLLGLDAPQTTGKGTGLNDEQLRHKQTIITRALQFHRQDWDGSPFDALRRGGGLEIAGMAGFILGAVRQHIPVVIDGFISGAAALVCLEWEPALAHYLFFGHESAEQFHHAFLDKINRQPLLDLQMRLGEGTGSALAMMLISQALNCYHEMATFAKAGVSGKIEG
jgi:nicotinate-nucleotide--dimethylbenzimidazole phosphoribosyltransferase